jgi:hypothetical protein
MYLLGKRYDMGDALSRAGEMRNAYKIFVGKFGGKRPFGRASVDGMAMSKRVLKKK